jgi:protein-disulfide isomerase
LSDLTSAPLPGLSDEDHVRGPAGAPEAVLYADFECPYCAAAAQQLEGARLRLAFRHFPVRLSHPRAWAASAAAEAAGRQGRFWEMHDLLFADPGRLEDPHLWRRAEQLGLDIARFDAERRSPSVRDRVRRDFRSGVRAGVVTTPTIFAHGRMYAGRFDPGVLSGRDY